MSVQENNPLVAPILKWAGGKRQLLPEIRQELPVSYTTYYEPFLGGGAVLFDLQPKRAVVNDVNEELINVYQVVKDDVEELITDLKRHKNNADYYYKIRGLDRLAKYGQLSPVQRASRIIYLNKTCYNGLFRVNRRGQFNVPFGRYKNPNIVNAHVLRAVSEYFNQADLAFRCCDFAQAVDGIQKGDFVYFDPPYDPISPSASFTDYNQAGFGREEQLRLKNLCDELHLRGIKFLLSNSATDFILQLYGNYEIKTVKARRVINSKGKKRGEVAEVLVKNY